MSRKNIYKTLYLSAFILLIPLTLIGRDISGWSAPTESELTDNLGWRKENPNLYISAKADFDGDGREDEARLLISDKENKMGLFVTLSSQKGANPLLLEVIADKRMVEVMGIEVAKPGKYKTACGKGYWACKKGEPSELKLTIPAIDFFTFESANSFFVWDTKTRKFKRIWMSD